MVRSEYGMGLPSNLDWTWVKPRNKVSFSSSPRLERSSFRGKVSEKRMTRCRAGDFTFEALWIGDDGVNARVDPIHSVLTSSIVGAVMINRIAPWT